MTQFVDKIKAHLNMRRRILFESNPLSLSERLLSIGVLRPGSRIKNFILKRHHNEINNSYFKIGEFNIYYNPPYQVKDQNYLLQGISQVLAESFVLPLIFNQQVQIKPGDIVIDLGGSIGTTALIFSKLVGPTGKVYVFEPVMHSVITQNLKANGITNVEVIGAAVSDKSGELDIEVSDFCLDSSITKREYTKDYYSQSIRVPVISLDDFIAEKKINKIDFIKMDIEGAEELALNGFQKNIDKFKPKWSISSYHIDFENEPQHPKLMQILKKHNYQMEEVRAKHIFAW